METTEGHLLGGRVRYTQPRAGFRSGIEPVLLAAFVPARPGEAVLEGGAGAGAALLCLAARVAGLRGVGIERDPALAALARANAAANAQPGLVFQEGDIHRAFQEGDIGHLGHHAAGAYDHAFANPPYHPAGGTASPDPSREDAKRAAPGTLAGWTEALARCLRPRGTVTLILPAGGAPEVLAAMAAAGVGGGVLLPLWPKPGRAAKLVLLRGTRGGKAPFRVLAGLVLHRAEGGFTTEAEAILRDGAALTSD